MIGLVFDLPINCITSTHIVIKPQQIPDKGFDNQIDQCVVTSRSQTLST